MRRLERKDGEDGMAGLPALVNMARPVNGGHGMSQGSDDDDEVTGLQHGPSWVWVILTSV